MKKEKETVSDDGAGLEERIANTAKLLAAFAKENLDEKSADEVLGVLSDIIKKDSE